MYCAIMLYNVENVGALISVLRAKTSQFENVKAAGAAPCPCAFDFRAWKKSGTGRLLAGATMAGSVAAHTCI